MEDFDIIEFLKYLKKRIILVILIAAIIMIYGVAQIKKSNETTYESFTTILVVDDESVEENFETDTTGNKELTYTYIQILKSGIVLDKTIENLGLNTTKEKLVNKLSLYPAGNSRVIRIAVTDKTKENLPNIANEMVKVFSEELNSFYKNKTVLVLDEAKKAVVSNSIDYKEGLKKYIFLAIVAPIGIVFMIFYVKSIIKTLKEDK